MGRFLDQREMHFDLKSIVVALGLGSFCFLTTKIKLRSLIPTCKFPLVANLSGCDVKTMLSNVLEQ